MTRDITPDNPLIGWHNLVTRDNIVADEEADGFPATSLANPATFTNAQWQGADTSEQYLTISVNDRIDYIGIAGHNFASAGIVVSVEGRASSGDDWSVLYPETTLAKDGIALFRLTPQKRGHKTGLGTLSDVRLRMQAGTAPPQAAVLYAGRLLVVQRRVYVGHTPLQMGRVTQVVSGMSENANFLGRIITGEARATDVSLSNLTPAWYRANMEPFIEAAVGAPFFFAWRPGSYPDEIGFAWLTGDVKPSNQSANGLMSVTLSIAGITN